MPYTLHKQGDKNKIAFKLIADIFQLIALVSIDITDAQQSLDNRESLAPIQHEQHQHQPLQISQDSLPSSQILQDPSPEGLKHLKDSILFGILLSWLAHEIDERWNQQMPGE